MRGAPYRIVGESAESKSIARVDAAFSARVTAGTARSGASHNAAGFRRGECGSKSRRVTQDHAGSTDGGAKVVVGEAANRLGANRRTYPEDTQFRLCFNDIPRASLARLIGNMHPRAVRARDGKAEERLSGQATGTVAELAARYELVVD